MPGDGDLRHKTGSGRLINQSENKNNVKFKAKKPKDWKESGRRGEYQTRVPGESDGENEWHERWSVQTSDYTQKKRKRERYEVHNAVICALPQSP